MDPLLKAQQAAKQPVIYCDPNDLQGFIFGVYETITVGKKSETRTFALYSEAPEIAQNRLLIEPAMLEKLGYVPKAKEDDRYKNAITLEQIMAVTKDLEEQNKARGNDAVDS
jgi:hypothetical protein